MRLQVPGGCHAATPMRQTSQLRLDTRGTTPCGVTTNRVEHAKQSQFWGWEPWDCGVRIEERTPAMTSMGAQNKANCDDPRLLRRFATRNDMRGQQSGRAKQSQFDLPGTVCDVPARASVETQDFASPQGVAMNGPVVRNKANLRRNMAGTIHPMRLVPCLW
jgi:hypothetical protein